jgi:DNA-binding NarL/FixJ family response regulator/tetratricopeptide (TPR) repeat protein
MESSARDRQSRKLKRRRIIERPRLFALLDESPNRIRTLVAPAGYGKTTLAEQWVARHGRRRAWFKARSASTDVAALALGMARAAAELVPECDEPLRAHLRVVPNPGERVDVLAEILGEELAEWQPTDWLVLDEYQELVGATDAESFVEELAAVCPVQLLIASRQRPTWVTGRRILYGDVLELNQTVLAMDAREAAELLEGRSAASASGLVALAHGWPAVIALASVTDAEIDGDAEVPDSLYRFFAEEVFDALGEGVRAGLATLAVAPVLDRELAAMLLDDAEAVCEAALQVGIMEERDGRLELHPLARSFLVDRASLIGGNSAAEAAVSCYEHYTAKRDWDAAFEIIATRGSVDEVAALLTNALDDLLESALLPTIVTWCEAAISSRVDAPIVALARAEVALRNGRHSEAQAFAEVAANGGVKNLRFRALSLAGAAAHLASREVEAMRLFQRAEAAASSDVERRDSLWGQLRCATELELPEAGGLLASLVAGVDFADPREVVRASASDIGYQLKFGLSDATSAETAAELVTSVGDPLIRTSFRNMYAHWLVLSARYSEAAELVDELLDDIARSRLDFAEPYALVSAATAAAGMRRWSDAHSYIERAIAAATSERNPFAEQSCYAAQVRALTHQGKQRSALSIEVPALDDAIASIRGEVLAIRGLVLATVGRVDEACSLIDEVRGTTAAVETAVLSAALDAVVALKRRDPNAGECVMNLEVTAFDSGALDLLVMTYRACPELLARLLRGSSDTTRLSGLIARVGDGDLAAAVGHPAPDDGTVRLTPREREVYALLREGLSNREIAAALVISEATAKLHTHHVLEKTGMRSRTEILIQAALERADQATSAMGESAGADASS